MPETITEIERIVDLNWLMVTCTNRECNKDHLLLKQDINKIVEAIEKYVEKIIQEIYTTGEYDFKNGSSFNFMESGVFKQYVLKARIKQHREYLGYTDDFKEISEYAKRRIVELKKEVK